MNFDVLGLGHTGARSDKCIHVSRQKKCGSAFRSPSPEMRNVSWCTQYKEFATRAGCQIGQFPNWPVFNRSSVKRSKKCWFTLFGGSEYRRRLISGTVHDILECMDMLTVFVWSLCVIHCDPPPCPHSAGPWRFGARSLNLRRLSWNMLKECGSWQKWAANCIGPHA